MLVEISVEIGSRKFNLVKLPLSETRVLNNILEKINERFKSANIDRSK